jgi:bacterial/archaeal transporter family-2 protein
MRGASLAVALLVLAAGAAGGLQAAANGQLGRRLGTPEATLISIGISFTLVSIAFLAVRRGGGALSEITTVPAVLLVGGVCGVVIVFVTAFAPGRLGVLATIALLIAGQLVAGALIDAQGWLGVRRVPLSALRVVGIALTAVGALMTLRR